MKKITIIAIALFGLLLFNGCKKDNNASNVAVRLKDAPANWDKVNLEIKGVQLRGSSGEWITVPMNTRVIDILQLRDSSVLLGNVHMPVGTISEIKLMVGTQNTITIGNLTFTISIDLADEDDLVLQVHETVGASGTFVLVVDLDAANSVLDDGDGQHFHLKAHLSEKSHHNEHDMDND